MKQSNAFRFLYTSLSAKYLNTIDHSPSSIVQCCRITLVASVVGFVVLFSISTLVLANSPLPISDVHIHYSHDSVELTPPERVIEIMREANIKIALVSSSDDNGTQLLSQLAPDIIVPGLRPYRKRGETSTWFTDQGSLDYVEDLLDRNQYASIGEFHLFGKNADLPIPRRIVELAEEHNLILHAHSDADAVERLLAQSDSVKVIWAHSGFDGPEEVARMLGKHDRLWADLAFRSDVGSGGSLSDGWQELFEAFPDRMMLGTDTYTPERMYFIPSHAEGARAWLSTLPQDLAQKVAWKNGFDLIMPIWEKNKAAAQPSNDSDGQATAIAAACESSEYGNASRLDGEKFSAWLETNSDIEVSKATSVSVILCGDIESVESISLDASMPAHGHGTNYKPTITSVKSESNAAQYQVNGLVMHMPGQWQWEMRVNSKAGNETLIKDFGVE